MLNRRGIGDGSGGGGRGGGRGACTEHLVYAAASQVRGAALATGFVCATTLSSSSHRERRHLWTIVVVPEGSSDHGQKSSPLVSCSVFSIPVGGDVLGDVIRFVFMKKYGTGF